MRLAEAAAADGREERKRVGVRSEGGGETRGCCDLSPPAVAATTQSYSGNGREGRGSVRQSNYTTGEGGLCIDRGWRLEGKSGVRGRAKEKKREKKRRAV